jgi:drug/metabolite transporter (DMT)-like permease
MKYLIALLATALGVAGVVLGEADDSPGLQLIGVVFIVGAVVLSIRTAQRSRKHVQPPLSPE